MAVDTEMLISRKFPEVFNKYSDKKFNQASCFMKGVKELIELCGDDPKREGLQETPYRVLKAFLEYTEGYPGKPQSSP